MKATLAGGSHVLLAAEKDSDLLSNVVQSTEDFLIAVKEAQGEIRDARIGTELLNKSLNTTEVVARYTREQVVNSLELEAAVDEVQPLGAVDIHGRAKLALRE